MTTTPKWYCRSKSAPIQTFAELSKLGQDLRRITKRIVIDVRIDVYGEHDNVLEDCERIVELYFSFKDTSKNKEFFSLSRKIKRSPYNALLERKLQLILEANERRFYQLLFVLKKSLSLLLRKSSQSDIWLHWALRMTHIYNKAQSNLARLLEEEAENEKDKHANICSNMFPTLLLLPKPIDFAQVLQLVSQSRIEQNSLDLMFGLFNMSNDGRNAATWPEQNSDSNCSSLEIFRILTLNLTGDFDFETQNNGLRSFGDSTQPPDKGIHMHANALMETTSNETNNRTLRRKHTEHFLHKERIFLSQLIMKINQISPSVLGNCSSDGDLRSLIARGMHLIWSHIGLVLDHILLWWIDTPISCYSLKHIDEIRNWLYAQSVNDIPEPVYSTLRAIGEILTNFVSNHIWDQLFRLTLISKACAPEVIDRYVQQYSGTQINNLGTATGTVWLTIFSSLVNLSNNYFPESVVHNSSLVPVSEQIPILHRIDHTVHSMRLWVKEQAKQLCNSWTMDVFFRILEHDVKLSLAVFSSFKLPKLSADLSDVLMLVCVALRTKLITEVNANIDKLKKTTDECVQIMSSVCRILSLANLRLSFPAPLHWQQNVLKEDQDSSYVGYLLEQVLLPIIRATKDINILNLVLKLVCEAWLDHIYEQRIKFSVSGAHQLLRDFDIVREWLRKCELLDADHLEKLCSHEVLRMCKGVGKILLRKPEDVICIAQSPVFDKKAATNDDSSQETHLPSEMFVSNQKNWLQLRASTNNYRFLQFCCGNDVL